MRRAAKRDANERAIIVALQLAGWSVFQMSAPGFPDLMCVKGGRVMLVEVKMPKGKPTPEQDALFIRLGLAGLPPLVVRSVEDALRAVKPKTPEPPFDADNHNGRPGRKAGGE